MSMTRFKRVDGAKQALTARNLEQGVYSICKAVGGKYTDFDGETKRVNGDFTKVRYVTALSQAGREGCQQPEHLAALEIRQKAAIIDVAGPCCGGFLADRDRQG